MHREKACGPLVLPEWSEEIVSILASLIFTTDEVSFSEAQPIFVRQVSTTFSRGNVCY
jgi:hypothetical protein